MTTLDGTTASGGATAAPAAPAATAVATAPLRPLWPAPADVIGLVTTRSGGVSVTPYDDASGSGAGGLNLGYHTGDAPEAVTKNRDRLAHCVGARPIAWVDQCHGVDVAVAGEVIRSAETGHVSVADAVISDQVDEVCAVMVADCLPVLFADTQSRVVGAAHAGWRGLCGGVLERTVEAMRATVARATRVAEMADVTDATRHARTTEDGVVLLAYLGPSIGPTAFEVGAEVREAFLQAALPDERAATSAAFVPLTPSTATKDAPHEPPLADRKYLGDLPALARLRLARVGVTSVYGGDACTVTEPRRFYSYRRDGRTGRFAALIWRQR